MCSYKDEVARHQDEVSASIGVHAGPIGDNGTAMGAIETLTASMTLVGDEFAFTGVNVNIQDDTGTTECGVAPCTGLGNLVVGYNEDTIVPASRIGSHNLIVGTQHEYASHGGFVAGTGNTVTGAFASVRGSDGNVASGGNASVSGGNGNVASGGNASVSGGMGILGLAALSPAGRR